MPVQSLTRFDRRTRRRWAAPQLAYTPWLSRLLVFGGTLALTIYGAREMYGVVNVGSITPLKWALLILFVANFSWIALAFTSGVLGFLWLVLRAPKPPALPATLHGKGAVVMPIYNEAPSRVFGALQAIYEDVAATGLAARFDWFFLSDTTNSDIWIAEERAFLAMRARLGDAAGIYYRHRPKNVSRKAGNIVDFITRWGGAYDHMVVLDADSLMTGHAIVSLAAAMEADPDAGIIQTLPLIINRNTIFARVQQFAARIYGPVIAAGLAVWSGRDGNYWGHNAIIRTAAFAAHCGLPNLRGRPPFGGHILSHDFVEAALMRRAGYAVYMLPVLGGSYEESPPSLIDLAARDRRWCQGNLQHVRIIAAKGLKLASRQHLATGIMGYLASPLWMAQLLIGIALVLQSTYIRPEYFTNEFTLFPAWPRFDAARALALFDVTMAVLLAPKFFGLLIALCQRRTRQLCGGVIRLLVSTMIEIFDVGADRADHDGHPDGFGRADRLRPRHRLEPAAARRRLDPARRDRAPAPVAYRTRHHHADRRLSDFAFSRRLDVADDRRPRARHPDLLGERPIGDRPRLQARRTAGDAGGSRTAVDRRPRQYFGAGIRRNRR